MVKFESALDRILDDFMEEFSLPGYDCAVWQHGQEIYRRISGAADLETGTPVTRSTLYNLYSNTKVITCVAALQLFEQGLFLLEDQFSRFFPEFAHMKVRQPDGSVKDAGNPVTIRDLHPFQEFLKPLQNAPYNNYTFHALALNNYSLFQTRTV